MDLNLLLNSQDQSPRKIVSNTTKQPLSTVDTNATLPPKSVTAGKAAPPPNSNKRRADEPAEISDIDTDSDRCQDVDISCDAVRRKIHTFLASGEMEVGEFQRAIGASSKIYSNFMGQNGPDKGSGSSVYGNAFAFFKKRELKGQKMPRKKVKKEDEAKKHDVADVQLEGESEGEVPVFDTCDEVRRKIRAYVAEPAVTQAGFLRAIAQCHPEKKVLQSKSLNDFLGKKGPDAGNTSGIFYSAYVFFEKIRIKSGKPKSKHRLEMEKIYIGGERFRNGGKPGMDIKRPSGRGYTCLAGEVPVMDPFGRVSFR